MLIRTLQSWGGQDFNLAAGDVIEVPEQTGLDRIAAGLAEDATPIPVPPPAVMPEPAAAPVKRGKPAAFGSALD